MYELIQVAPDAYYMDCPSKVGFYRTDGDRVVLIDAGSDKDAAKKVKRILDENGWKLTAIYNTHAHADHIGGNQYLQNATGCDVFAPGIEACFAAHPVLEPTVLCGGYAMRDMRGKFLMAKESAVRPLTPEALPDGLEAVPLPGHSYGMVGYRTKSGAFFIADCLSAASTLEKYGVGYLYDVRAYLDTLEYIKTAQAACFIPSHAEVTADIRALADVNIGQVKRIVDTLRRIVSVPESFEDILAEVFDAFGLTATVEQYALVGSTVRSYLSYLKDEGAVTYVFEGNRMLWKTV